MLNPYRQISVSSDTDSTGICDIVSHSTEICQFGSNPDTWFYYVIPSVSMLAFTSTKTLNSGITRERLLFKALS